MKNPEVTISLVCPADDVEIVVRAWQLICHADDEDLRIFDVLSTIRFMVDQIISWKWHISELSSREVEHLNTILSIYHKTVDDIKWGHEPSD